jgi:enamine deaminase RidA (YjgF/YER057c/UK114 family)
MIERIEAGPRMSQAVVYPAGGRMVVLAGQVPNDTSLDVGGQTADVLAKVDALLAAAGADKTMLVSAYIWLSDIATFDEMNAVWDKWVVPGQAPARACVEARLARPDIKVEIQVIAAIA